MSLAIDPARVFAQANGLGPIGRRLEETGIANEAMAASAASVLRFVIAIVAIWFVGRTVVLPLIRRGLDRRGLDEHAKNPLLMLSRFGVLFFGVAVAFGFAGFGNFLVSMAGIAAAGALAIGLAMQNVISNFVAGVFIYTDKPFRIGDWIEWDNGDYAGVVEDISLRVTRVRTFDNELLTVPNSSLTDNVLKNPVDADKLRLKFVFGIGYDDDIERATEIIVDEAERHPDIMDNPAPSVRLTELGDSDVGLQSRFWIANPSRADFVRTRGEYVTAVKRRFDEEGIDIPYPVRTLEGGLQLEEERHIGQPAE
ncbi:MscS Mechanosensitive ion channel [Haloterrigena turkmenica DSM 5511]|uniref:MscS Mechanosensitive ion channel n=1 Tax=Haloterrigena turkmenica (strain ATCC 51198 / DSM 5511 / JCM 9101 / NCIMB 13204 / VKM B-1734 / 4k) TaxID=543526 RepID=D2RYN3_HALTV|nr:mechanosensitive ion channel family protein [Haloterrigena turkmenica]ADB59934.1 MscS Mechanosensitive ion channel [Haloterrigena turkmenica DSM 5511]